MGLLSLMSMAGALHLAFSPLSQRGRNFQTSAPLCTTGHGSPFLLFSMEAQLAQELAALASNEFRMGRRIGRVAPPPLRHYEYFIPQTRKRDAHSLHVSLPGMPLFPNRGMQSDERGRRTTVSNEIEHRSVLMGNCTAKLSDERVEV